MYEQIMKYAIRLLQYMRTWKIYVGRDPQRVPPRSLIIFPVRRSLVCCGLAGILAFTGKGREDDENVTEILLHAIDAIQDYGLEKVICGTIRADRYLGGLAAQEAVAHDVLRMKGDAHFETFFFSDENLSNLRRLSDTVASFLTREEDLLEHHAGIFSTGEMEHINNAFIMMKDTSWALEKDILANIEKILYLANAHDTNSLSPGGLKIYRNINLLINALDRLEVRGRDSAGIQITLALNNGDAIDSMVTELTREGLCDEMTERMKPGDLMDGSIHVTAEDPVRGSAIASFTYKKASVTGKLGENGQYLRNRVRMDRILQAAIAWATETDLYLGHTRWASVGSITEENCHPVNNYTLHHSAERGTGNPRQQKTFPLYGAGNWSINVVLNGDIDNYSVLRNDLKSGDDEIIDKRITTDTKIIPLKIEEYLASGCSLTEAFRLAVNDFDGSHAIAMQSNLEPDKLFLALKGSGQSLYVGISDDRYMFSSELYGLVEMTPRFIKMDGEQERIAGDASTKGQFLVLNRAHRALYEGIAAFYYDGYPLEISDSVIQRAEITTRDIDRKEYPHYLLKEILEAPLSARKTLRGKYRITNDRGMIGVRFNLGNDIVPERLRHALTGGGIRKIFVIGQGTAAVAGAAIAEALTRYLKGSDIIIKAMKASELSGFILQDDLSDLLVIPVTQSGTTTDTNRAVVLAKERGAHLIAIVNRRQSDITHVTDGVFYTSDGRDIEMSVASTKAFYAQVVAGFILALYCAKLMGTLAEELIAKEIADLEQATDRMNKVIASREAIRSSAWNVVKEKKYWAVVGSGPNKIAADEIRIKLSELCYKTISSDNVEDKKHIDLSSEPLILICAAGNPKPVVEDIIKDVAIFKAHAAAAVVLSDEDEARFDGIADSVIKVPESTFPTSLILNTLAGHIWGYYAACSINEEGEFFRDFRTKLAGTISELDRRNLSLFEKIADIDLHKLVEQFSTAFHARKNRSFFSSLSVELAADLVLLMKYAVGKLPLEDFWEEFKEKRTSSSPLDMLDVCLGRTIDELARPIDAIRHQAKTVTVGTSRKSEMLSGILFDVLKGLRFALENLTSKDGVTARRIQNAIAGIRGYTLYEVKNLDYDGKPGEFTEIKISERHGISRTMKSRFETAAPLKGTKKTIISTGAMYAGLGKRDKASIVMMPLLGKDHLIRQILLVHVDFNQGLTPSEKKEILGDKFNRINNLVNEYNLVWHDRYLQDLPIEYLLGEGVDVIVRRIRHTVGEDEKSEA